MKTEDAKLEAWSINLGGMGHQSGHLERAVKHLGIAASVGDYGAMQP
jgi:hypothetical protein